MSPTVINVAPSEFRRAAALLGDTVATQLRSSWVELQTSLENSTGMAGSDEVAMTWGASYDDATTQALSATTDLLNSSSRVGALLDQSGINYEFAEAASAGGGSHTPGGGPRYTLDWVDTLGNVSTSIAPGTPPPDGWSTLQSRIGYLWPDGHQDRLRSAAAAWRLAARQCRAVVSYLDDAYRAVFLQRVPESGDAATVVDTVSAQATELAGAYDDIADSCELYAHHLDEAHHAIIGVLRDFLIWTATIEAAAGLFATVTFGLSEAIGQGGEAFAIARWVNAIRGFIEALLAEARLGSAAIDLAATRASAVVAAVRPILAKHLEEVRIAMSNDRGELVIGRKVSSQVDAQTAATPTGKALQALQDDAEIGPASETWGNMRTLQKHFKDHGRDFGAISEEDYARQAAEFYRRATSEGLPKKVDLQEGTIQFYDKRTNSYAAYRMNGETRTYFKPKRGERYWDDQPGTLTNG